MTIRDIANLAKVSPATVSLVLNNKKGVGEKTRKRVQKIIDENDYIPIKVSRKKQGSIVLIKYRTHGMAVEENQGFIVSITDQIESECHRFSFDLSTVSCTCKNVEKVFKDVMDSSPDGVVLLGTEFEEEHFHLLHRCSIPLVVVDNSMRYVDVDCVVMANENIAYTAVKYLYDLGHRRIGYFKTSTFLSNLRERYLGYLEAQKELKIPPTKAIGLTPTLNGAYMDMKKLIESGEYIPSGAVFADNDSIAIGASKAILEAGYRIPEDVSIMGVDDIPFSAVTTPALTTMRISRHAMGVLVVDVIRKRIKYPHWPAMHFQITGELIERDSTARVEG